MARSIREMFTNVDKHDKKSVEFLLKAIEESNLPGFDYLEFKQALKGLRKMNMDETTAIKSAFTTGNTVGLTKSKLISSAEHYRQVLLKEKNQFDAALQKQMAQRVDGKKTEKEALTKKMDSYRSKIKELENEILKLQEKFNKADGEIEAAKAKIIDTKEKFESTFQSFVTEIEADLEHLNEVL
ncbi:MAG: hypothetical protein HKN76_17175 [Saprospiraceae bacterium]|nr:hypothetical protein [Saprospiraceae bacterium]